MDRADKLGDILDSYKDRQYTDGLDEEVDTYIGVMFIGKDKNCLEALYKLDMPIKQKIVELHKLACKGPKQEINERLNQVYEVLENKYDEGIRLERWLDALIEAWEQ